jgi:hypothetical protein
VFLGGYVVRWPRRSQHRDPTCDIGMYRDPGLDDQSMILVLRKMPFRTSVISDHASCPRRGGTLHDDKIDHRKQGKEARRYRIKRQYSIEGYLRFERQTELKG